MTMKKITKKAVVVILGVSLWHSIAINKKYNNVSNELEMVMKSNNKLKIDSLLQEIMDIGWKNDSLTLKYEYGWEF
jgi:excinuclease UvrABC helicase subunit UvrB